MSGVVRLTMVSHGMTDAMAAGRFPVDESLNALGRRQVAAMNEIGAADEVLSGPEARVRETAELLGVSARVDHRLADVDNGRWRGGTLTGIEPADLTAWLTDPGVAPHGGESITDLVARVGEWLDAVPRLGRRVLAVTHPALIRATVVVVLDAPPHSFWRIDIAPASCTALHFRGSAWTLRR